MSERKRTKWQQVAITASQQAQVSEITRLEVEKLREELENWLAALEEIAADAPPSPGMWQPTLDLCESETEIVLTVELAGVLPENIEVLLTPKLLRIHGEKKRRGRRNDVSYLCGERTYGKFSREITIRRRIDLNAATAELTDGILSIRLPKLNAPNEPAVIIPLKFTETVK